MSIAAITVITIAFFIILYSVTNVLLHHSTSTLERVTLALLNVVVLIVYLSAVGIIPVEHV